MQPANARDWAGSLEAMVLSLAANTIIVCSLSLCVDVHVHVPGVSAVPMPSPRSHVEDRAVVSEQERVLVCFNILVAVAREQVCRNEDDFVDGVGHLVGL
jgi:hypothetical protein